MKLIHAVMAGGVGSRLWPFSRQAHPKQFLEISSDNSMIVDTLTRYQNVCFDSNLVLCSQEHKFLVADELNHIKLETDILLEPVGKNTAPTAVLAALHVISKYDDGVILLSPSDHAMHDIANLESMIHKGIKHSKKGNIITFGITPDEPETGYGYIQVSEAIEDSIYDIKQFVEKPNAKKAKEYLDSKDYLWNSGIYLFKASTLLAEIAKYFPEMLHICQDSYANHTKDSYFYNIPIKFFEKCPEDSLDYAVMEKTNKGLVTQINVQWNDLGSWKSIWEYYPKDERGNVQAKNSIQINSNNTLIQSDSNKLITTIGVNNIAVLDTKDALLVIDLENAQDVKKVVKQLKKDNRSEYIKHREVHSPWGMYDKIDDGDRYQVKKTTVKPGGSLPLQLHYQRAEHWIVVRGTALVKKGFCKDALKEHLIRENESIYIELGESHQLINPGKTPLELVEVQSGAYLGDDDVVLLDETVTIEIDK